MMTARSGVCCLRERSVSKPFISCMLMSRKRISGNTLAHRISASLPLHASPTTSILCCRSKVRSRWRVTLSSSAITALIIREIIICYYGVQRVIAIVVNGTSRVKLNNTVWTLQARSVPASRPCGPDGPSIKRIFHFIGQARLYTWRAICSPILLMRFTIQTDTNAFHA